MAVTILVAFATAVLGLCYGLLLGGISRKVMARIHGRIGPPVTQNFSDLVKLFFKRTAIEHGGMFWLAPMFRLTGGLGVLFLVPIVVGRFSVVNISFAGDLLLVVYFMFFGCLGMALGAGDSGHPHAVMAVSRGLAQMSTYELSFSMVVLVLAVGLGTLNIGDIVAAQSGGIGQWNLVRYPFATAAAMIAFLPMQMAYPFSVVLAPQEIPIGPPTEYGSRFLSLMLAGRSIFGVAKLVLYMNLFFGGASNIADLVMKTLLLYLYPVFVSAVFPRFRLEQSVRFLLVVPTVLALVELIRVIT